ncbi:MAG: hypothetical protein H7841_10685 [Magnetospirillum sp. WYHS-4]
MTRDPAPPVPGAVSVDAEVGVPTDARAMGFWLKALLGELNDLADAMEASTMATAEGVMDASSVLATFRSVSGDTFIRAIKAAQDLPAVLRRDDPRHRLNRAGVPSSSGVTVVVQPTVTNTVPNTQTRTETRRGPSGEVMIAVFVEQMEMLMSRKIGRGEDLAPTLERRYGLNPAAGAYR